MIILSIVFVLCFLTLLIIIFNAPEYEEAPDGTLKRIEEEKNMDKESVSLIPELYYFFKKTLTVFQKSSYN